MKEEADIKQIYGIRLLRSNEHAKGTKMEFEFGHQKELGDSQKWKSISFLKIIKNPILYVYGLKIIFKGENFKIHEIIKILDDV